MFQVVKRDGEIAEFQMAKITSAIDKAFDAKEKNYSKDMIDLLALRGFEVHISGFCHIYDKTLHGIVPVSSNCLLL